MPALALLPAAARSRIAVINSGFGFADASPRPRAHAREPVIAYLGTVDFVKMHPGFFDAIDDLAGEDICVSVWGAPSGSVAARARAMRHPERITFMLETAQPAVALSAADIFFYPLQPDHYGTAENALVEAMSLGLVPVVLDNPAERAIVRDGETGFVARSIAECGALLQMLLESPQLRARMSANAVRDVAEARSPAHAAHDFVRLWCGMLDAPRRLSGFRKVIGDNPADWFLATQCLPGTVWDASETDDRNMTAKGTLAHFESAFAGDATLSRLRAQRRAATLPA